MSTEDIRIVTMEGGEENNNAMIGPTIPGSTGGVEVDVDGSDVLIVNDSRKRSLSPRPSLQSRPRSREENKRRRRRSRSRSRSQSSSSRDTYDSFIMRQKFEEDEWPEREEPYKCKICKQGRCTLKELAEHEIRAHDADVLCAHCEKVSPSVAKLAAHMLYRHPRLACDCKYCGDSYGDMTERVDDDGWKLFREHVYKEVLSRKMYPDRSGEKRRSRQGTPIRGLDGCPHGAPSLCKNFPNCPGARCIYSHGPCKHDRKCAKKDTCPFDHSDKGRRCMACINDLKAIGAYEDRHRKRY